MVDDEIIISLPGTSYSVTYYKPPNSPQLLAKNISQSDDNRTSLKVSDFLVRAWHTANAKASELGGLCEESELKKIRSELKRQSQAWS